MRCALSLSQEGTFVAETGLVLLQVWRFDSPAHFAVAIQGGGACEIAINANRVLCIAAQTKKSFPAKIDFMTSPGHLTGGDDRAKLGMRGAGPQRVREDVH